MNFIDYFMQETSWLYTRIYQNDLFFFDLWSLVHLWSGFSIYLLLNALNSRRPLLTLASILVVYEILEILFVYIAFSIFKPETIKDQFTDILLGLTGGLVSKLFIDIIIKYYDRYPGSILAIIMFVVSSTYAFVWVGFYQYSYNFESYNTPGINVLSWLGWTSGGLFILVVFRWFRKIRFPYRLGLTWILYFLALLAFEYFYYYMLEVKEISGLPLKPLVFGLVHGTRILHVFYILAPFIILSIYRLGTWLYNRSVKQDLIRY